MKKVLLILCMCMVSVAAQADLVSAPYIAGDFQDPTWQAGDTPMTSLGGGMWEYTITGTPGAYEQFKITTGSWDDPTAPASNSWYTIPGSGQVTVTFNTNIVLDGWLPEQFRVGVSTDPGAWNLVGDFNGWNNNDPTQAMTSLGGGIYEKTQTFGAGTYNLKPVKGGGSWDGIGTDGRSIDALNLNLVLASPTSVTIYVDAFTGVFGTGDTISLNRPYDPDPANNAVVPYNTVADLSWSNPAPIVPTDTLGVAVKFELEASGVYDPNWGGANAIPVTTATASGTDIETVALSAMTNPPTLPLTDDSLYSWQVTITDPNTGGLPVVTEGTVWLFEVGDSAPVVSQPVGEYMYLSQDDSAVGGIGDTNPNVRYFEVTASYTDDGKSPITVVDMNNLSWGWDPLGPDGIVDTGDEERGVTEVSDVHTPGTGGGTVTAIYKTEYNATDPNYTTDLPGNWNIRLEVTDGSGTATGASGHYEIYATCGGAAYWDPDDTFDGTYDFNGDCIVNLTDFSVFAEAWLYQGVKYE